MPGLVEPGTIQLRLCVGGLGLWEVKAKRHNTLTNKQTNKIFKLWLR
jgi:hypothetical protein